VCHALDPDARHGRAGERGEEHATQRGAERVAEAAIEWLDREAATRFGDFLGCDLGCLELEHGVFPSRRVPPRRLLGADGDYFE
jgi:hypothetical protein